MKKIKEEIPYDRPYLYPKQEGAFFNGYRFSWCEASTKAGKTAGALAWLTEQAVVSEVDWSNHWWVAPVYRQTEIAFDRFKRGSDKRFYKSNDSDLRIELPNKSLMWFLSGEKYNNLYGDDVYSVVADEASRMREDSYNAIYSTLTATRGMGRFIGNVRGKNNWFYKKCRAAQQEGSKDFYSKITAYDAIEAGVLDPEVIEEAKQDLPDHVFRELYLAEPSDDGGNPFGLAAIESCKGAMSRGEPIIYGVDLAKSYDWTVIIGLDKNQRVCFYERFQKSWKETFNRLDEIAGNRKMIIDSTGVGDPIVERLNDKYGDFIEGYKFSAQSKQILMEGLSVAIQRNEISFPDNQIATELESFEYEYYRGGVRYSAPQGVHDDCVMALALAVYGCNNIPRDPELILPDAPDEESIETVIRY